MALAQVISGDYSKIIVRVKAGEKLELGQLLVIDNNTEKFILQVYDLLYGSQISQQNLELVSGLNLEEGNFEIMNTELRNYQLAFLKPLLELSGNQSKTCKKLPSFFSTVREIGPSDLAFITRPVNPFYLGKLRSGSKRLEVDVFLPGEKVFSEHLLIAASTGKGKSNLISNILWDVLDKEFCGLLVLDPHDEYYGRKTFGLKNHPKKENLTYYSINPPIGARTLKINLKLLKPEHFEGAINFSDPQRQSLYAYYKKFKEGWIEKLLKEVKIEGVSFHEDTIAVVKRRLITVLNLEMKGGELSCQGVFDSTAGENTITDVCLDLEKGKIVIVDTSLFSGAIELLIGSMLTTEVFNRYKHYKTSGVLENKPVISIILEEAPRVLGKQVLEQGPNIFSTIAREGRKFKVGLLAITQLPSEIPKPILANLNTKIILGLEMSSERQAVIESSPQDLSQDARTIASLDKGEALITSVFTKFAVPVSIPLFQEFAEQKNLPPEAIDIDYGLFNEY